MPKLLSPLRASPATASATVCQVKRNDLFRCLGHAENHYRELGWWGDFDSSHFLKTWETLYDATIAEVVGLVLDGVDIGGMGLLAAPDQCTPELVASVMWVFIDESHRGGLYALQLLRYAERWGRSHHARKLRMGYHFTKGMVSSDQIATPITRVYKAFGLSPMGMFWQKDL